MNAATTSLGHMAGTTATISGAPNAKPLWAAVGVLSVCVLAMGASIIHINKRPAEPVAAIGTPSVSALALASPNAANSANKGNMITEMADGMPEPKAAPAPQKAAQPATKTVAKHVTAKTSPTHAAAPAAAPAAANAPQAAVAQPAPQPVVVAQAPVCANCGTVQAVTPVTRQGKGSGVGVVAGGVAGAVLGNQVGGGDGRKLATILGAVGGGLAGNAIEKNVKKTTVYSVTVRMEDGSTRTLEEATAPSVGAKVKVDGSTLSTI